MQERRLVEAPLAVYVAMATVPAAATLTVGPPTGARDGAVLLGGGLALAVGVAVLARTVEDLPSRVVSPAVAAACLGPPLAYLPYMLVATEPGSPAAGLAATGLLAAVPGLFVPIAGAAVESRRARRAATETLVVTVGDDEDGPLPDGAAAAGATLFGFALVATGAFAAATGEGDAAPLVAVFGGLSSTLAALGGDDDVEVAVTDLGVRLDRSFLRWESLVGYRVTDDAVELVRPGRLRPTRELQRAGLSDDETDRLRAALAEHLPRLGDDGRVERPARR